MKIYLVPLLATAWSVRAAPANDEFASRIDLGNAASLSVTADANGCSWEPLEPHRPAGFQPRVAPTGGSVWWSWTAPSDGWMEIDPKSAALLPERTAVVYTGSTLQSLNPVNNARAITAWFADQRLHFPAVAGQTYHIAVCLRDSASDSGIAHFTLQPVASPSANDQFASRMVLPDADSISVPASNLTATLEAADAPWISQPDEDASLWWQWSCPTAGLYRIAATGSESPLVQVLLGSAADSLVAVNAPQGFFSAQAGRTYQIRAASAVSGTGGPFQLELHLADGGSDARSAAPVVAAPLPASASGATRGKTIEIGEPGTPGFSKSVWWRWTAPTSMTVSLELQTLAGNAIAELIDATTLNIAPASVLSWRPASGKPPVQFDVVAGREYFVRIASGAELWCRWILTPAAAPPPAPVNDDFVNASDLGSAERGLVPLTAQRYSAEAGAAGAPGADFLIWWKWTAPHAGYWEVSAKAQIFTGISLDSLTRIFPLAGNVLPAAAGQSFYFAVAPNAGLGWGMRPLETLTNDDFAAAIDLGSEALARHSHFGIAGGLEDGEPDPENPSNSHSYWWKWTAPASGWLRFSATLPVENAEVAAFEGGDVANLTPVPNARAMLSSGHPVVMVPVSAGGSYFLRVAVASSALRPFAVEVRPFAPAANPAVASATDLGSALIATSVSTYLGSGLFGATANDPARLVWWKWTAPASGVVSVLADGDDSLLDVPCCQTRGFLRLPSQALQPISETNHASDDYHSLYLVEAGETYYFCLRGGVDAEQARIRLELWTRQPLPNDSFAAAASLEPGLGFTGAESHPLMDRFHYQYSGGTVESGEPARNAGTRSTVWWQWTPVRTMSVVAYAWRLAEPPGSYSPRGLSLDVFTGGSLGVLSDVSDLGGPAFQVGLDNELAAVYFEAQAGVTYRFRLQNPYEMQWGETLPATPVAPGLLSRTALRVQAVDPATALAAFYQLDPETVGKPLARLGGDDLANILKYAFGLDPHQNSAGSPRRPVLLPDGLNFQLGPLPIPLPGYQLRITPSHSMDLQSWTDLPSQHVSNEAADAFAELPPANAQGRGFLRLKAEFTADP